MYIVRIQNDEAVMYRAFRRLQSAEGWAADRTSEDLDCLVDVLDIPDMDDLRDAVVRAQSGHALRLTKAETLTVPSAAVI